METKILNPLDIEGKINYPCNAHFRHKTLKRHSRGEGTILYVYNIGSWLYESEKSLKRGLYEDFTDRQNFLKTATLEDVELVVEEYTKEEYINHVKWKNGIMKDKDDKYFVPADDEYISQLYDRCSKIK